MSVFERSSIHVENETSTSGNIVWRTEGARPGDAAMEIDIDLESETITDSQGAAESATILVY
ncbi:hypothetical protein [Microbacterium sp.]|uniref:hypothetical protein n=1 Tax=Microbacterium sp. TaxID=51671 RepID=UPI002735F38E|nr:hypothetical protein [Microbacterium sp.]MDP3949137.1 hypothetical protein [Microbacterium sp.]